MTLADIFEKGASRAAVEKWASRRGVAWALDVDVRALEPMVAASRERWLLYRFSVVGDLLGKSGRAVPAALYEAARRFMAEAAARAEGVEEAWSASCARARAAEGAPSLKAARAHVIALREALVGAGGGVAVERRSNLQFELSAVPAGLIVHCDGPTLCTRGRRTVFVPLEEAGSQVSCACSNGAAPCTGKVAATEIVLEALAAPSPTAQAVESLLSKPLWNRQVALLTDMARPTSSQLQAEEQVGWRLVEDYGLLAFEAVAARPKKRGDGWVVRRTPVPADVMLQTETLERADRTLLSLAEMVMGERLPARAWVLEHLAGHPRVFDLSSQRGGARALAVQMAPMRVRWTRTGARLTATCEIGPKSMTPDELCALDASQEHPDVLLQVDRRRNALFATPMEPATRDMVRALRHLDGALPEEALPGLLESREALERAAPVELAGGLEGPKRAPDLRWGVRLTASDGGKLHVELRVQVFAGGAWLTPGVGVGTLYGELPEGGLFHVPRKLKGEIKAAQGWAGRLALEPPDGEYGDYGWTMEDPEASLDALAVIQAAQEADGLQVEWRSAPKRVTRHAGTKDLKLRVGPQRDWFGVEGGVEFDGVVVPFTRLAQAVLEGRSFVEADDGALVRLEAALRAQLEALTATATVRKKQVELSPFAGQALAELADAGAEVDGAQQWIELLQKVRAAKEIEPKVPAGLKATLRHYQQDGFVWLARLAEWGAGACLADDMGLGKTVQALALLLRRAEAGPALVVAPTSVGFNWLREAEKFAPELDVKAYRGGDREGLLEGLGPGAVRVTSYGLLQRDAKALAGVEWATVVLDEAQAIKNAATRTAKAACGLKAEMRVALTGTPLENHLGELWSLFRFLLPGLLGSAERFRENLWSPINAGDPKARARLAQIVRPFILRRTKGEVATELPERSEVVLEVRLSPPERKAYDQARLTALQALEKGGGDGPAQQRFQMLAALTRLRQLACHRRLVDAGAPAESAKLKVLRGLIAELREEGNRALVFSQFTSHLALARAALEADGVRVRYLDGSTPAKKRAEEVDAFQAGEGDVFLISTKAGGTGLNLTAASYVVHLDPWWNPAVEDQATDRAHRIGQEQPVTVYRLVAKGTIEEQVMSLHGEKRALADAVLGGAGAAGGLDTAALKALIEAAPGAGDEDEDDEDDGPGWREPATGAWDDALQETRAKAEAKRARGAAAAVEQPAGAGDAGTDWMTRWVESAEVAALTDGTRRGYRRALGQLRDYVAEAGLAGATMAELWAARERCVAARAAGEYEGAGTLVTGVGLSAMRSLERVLAGEE